MAGESPGGEVVARPAQAAPGSAASDAPPPSVGGHRQAEIFALGLAGQKPVVPTDPRRLEALAEQVMTPEGFGYIAGGAGTERTMAANLAAFDRWRIVPRMLCDVARRDLSVEVLGERLPTPLFLAPIGVLEMAHPDGDLAVARAAAAEGVPMILSSQASVPMERCAEAMGEAHRWYQLYWAKLDGLARSFVRRAEACGCRAIVLTLDTTMLGWRPRDLDGAYSPFVRARGIAQYTSDPVFRALAGADGDLERPVAVDVAAERFSAIFSRPWLCWDDLRTLRDYTSLPIFLKGILHPEDAARAVEEGVNGIVVSNHGGRQVDGAIASLDALPAVVDAVAGRLPVLFDSGIRSGADVFKALALGATAVCLGRPYAYGLAIAGEDGVRQVIRNVLAEFDLTLALSGCASVADLSRERLVPAP